MEKNIIKTTLKVILESDFGTDFENTSDTVRYLVEQDLQDNYNVDTVVVWNDENIIDISLMSEQDRKIMLSLYKRLTEQN